MSVDGEKEWMGGHAHYAGVSGMGMPSHMGEEGWEVVKGTISSCARKKVVFLSRMLRPNFVFFAFRILEFFGFSNVRNSRFSLN